MGSQPEKRRRREWQDRSIGEYVPRLEIKKCCAKKRTVLRLERRVGSIVKGTQQNGIKNVICGYRVRPSPAGTGSKIQTDPLPKQGKE
jgi:hypothetical protein